jgi:Flp pilus assembly protein TadD
MQPEIDTINSLINRGMIYQELGKRCQALREYEKALDLSPGNMIVLTHINRLLKEMRNG